MVFCLLYGPFLVILCAIFYKGLGLGVQGQSERSQSVIAPLAPTYAHAICNSSRWGNYRCISSGIPVERTGGFEIVEPWKGIPAPSLSLSHSGPVVATIIRKKAAQNANEHVHRKLHSKSEGDS